MLVTSKEIISMLMYDGTIQVELKATVNKKKTVFRVDAWISKFNLSLRQVGYKTPRAENFKFVSMLHLRGTQEEKRAQFTKQVSEAIPAELINYALEEVIKQFTYTPWEEQ